MRVSATTEERRLQDEIRAFLATERPHPAALPRALEDRMAALRAWQARCHAAGYVGRAWPRKFGGGGRPAAEQIVVDQELAAAGAPELANTVGLDVLGPSLLRFGSDEQRRRHIPAILSAEEIWCRASRSPMPARTSRRCARGRASATAPTWSAGRRPGCRGASSRAGA